MTERYKIECGMYTMVIVRDAGRALLLNRPDRRGFPGYLGPGGKVEMSESVSEAAVRELREETGLRVKPEDLIFKGIDEYVVPKTNYRYIVFNYLAQRFEGELLQHSQEGELAWVNIKEALDLPMQPWFKRRFPLFFEEGTFEICVIWDEDKKEPISEKVTRLR